MNRVTLLIPGPGFLWVPSVLTCDRYQNIILSVSLYNKNYSMEKSRKSIKDLASIGSVTVCSTANSVHVPAVRVASGMQSEKGNFWISQIVFYL